MDIENGFLMLQKESKQFSLGLQVEVDTFSPNNQLVIFILFFSSFHVLYGLLLLTYFDSVQATD